MNGNTVIRASQVFAEVSASLKMDKMESARVPSLNVGSETPSWRIQLSHSFVLGFVPTKQIEKQKLEKKKTIPHRPLIPLLCVKIPLTQD